jgi:hypothetical protein
MLTAKEGGMCSLTSIFLQTLRHLYLVSNAVPGTRSAASNYLGRMHRIPGEEVGPPFCIRNREDRTHGVWFWGTRNINRRYEINIVTILSDSQQGLNYSLDLLTTLTHD